MAIDANFAPLWKKGYPYACTHVSLTDHYDSFIELSITEGRFASASEAVRAAHSLLERQAAEDAAKLEWLRTAAQDAFGQLDRGEGVTLGSMDELDAYVEQVGAEVSAEIAAGPGPCCCRPCAIWKPYDTARKSGPSWRPARGPTIFP